jgi:RHS repeat-associated protein
VRGAILIGVCRQLSFESDGANVYLYDAEGRICAVSGSYGMTGYLYDAAGNRVAKGTVSSWSCDPTANGFTQTAAYVTGPGGEQLTELDANNNWKHTNVYAGGKLVGTYDSVGLHFHIDDPLGTRRAQASASGALEAVYQSLPFGDGFASNELPGVSDPTENHFTGKERDTESGNDYFLARYYNSATGRFLSPDWSAKEEPVPYAKLDNPQSLNLYSYVGSNPVTLSDLDGHTTWQQYLARAEDRAESALDSAGQKITGTAEFSIRDPSDRANALHKILGAANTAASIMVPAIATDGMSLEEEGAALSTEVEGTVAAPTSPEITAEELTGKTRSEIRDLANDKGLVPKGDTSHPDYPRKWSDPVTNEDRLRLDRGHVDETTGKPYDNPNAAADHVHGYTPKGKPIKVNGDKHIPTTGS